VDYYLILLLLLLLFLELSESSETSELIWILVEEIMAKSLMILVMTSVYYLMEAGRAPADLAVEVAELQLRFEDTEL